MNSPLLQQLQPNLIMSTEETHGSHSPNPPAKNDGSTPVLRPHTFDGIQEYDQHLPNWWLWTLYIAIIWTFISWIWEFNLSRPLNMATTDFQRVDKDVAAVKKQQADNLQKVLNSLDDKRFWDMTRDTEAVARGKVTYETICSACHGTDLTATMPGGVKLPGLPLHDKEWKYGAKPMDVFKIVTKGSPDTTKGMIAWEPQFGGVKCAEVVAYILSKHTQGADDTAQ